MKIAVITTNRADYGLLSGLIQRILKDRTVRLQLVVSGAHLSPTFGYTVREIIKDKIPIAAKIKNDSVAAFTKAFGKLKPDMMVVLGDRYEILFPCLAAVALRIPITHIHGGEITEGVLDEQVRHAITKMAHLHFVATETYRKNVIQMGENPKNVFTLGAPGIENIRHVQKVSKTQLEKILHFPLTPAPILVTLHPETLKSFSLKPAQALLKSIVKLDLPVIFTSSNPDAGGKKISKLFQNFAKQHKSKALFIPSLGYANYLSLVPHVRAVVGNSSSGIIEVPSLHTPTVNIGDRQRGRLMSDSVISCSDSENAITLALKKAVSEHFRKKCRTLSNPYGSGDFSKRALSLLKKKIRSPDLLHKTFYKIGVK